MAELPAERRKKILIVDDEYSFTKNLKAFLARTGYDVETTTNGEQALDMIAQNRPDIITLDIRMPGMNGYEVLEKLKWEKDISVIIISAIDMPNMEEGLIHAGAKAVLCKPVDLNDLLRTVKEVSAPSE